MPEEQDYRNMRGSPAVLEYFFRFAGASPGSDTFTVFGILLGSIVNACRRLVQDSFVTVSV